MNLPAILGGRPVAAGRSWGPSWPVHSTRERQLLAEVLSAPTWGATGMGPKIAQLNRSWAAYCGTARSVALANGTVTMELALRAYGVGPGDEVVVPAWTFAATAIAVSRVGAIPVFVDIDPDTLCIDPAALAAVIGPRTRAVIAVHFGGHPADMHAILDLAREHQLKVIEDAAQAHGAILTGRLVGSFGDAGSFSFQQSKNLQCGEGGSLVTDDEELADRLHFSLSKFGRGLRERYQPFTHHELAGNECMTEFQAAVLLAQLERLDDQLGARERSANYLRKELTGTVELQPLPVEASVDRHGNHLFLLRLHNGSPAPLQRVVEALQAEGVPAFSLYPRPLFEEPIWAAGGAHARVVTDCPETYRASREIVALPQTLLLGNREDCDLVIEAFIKVARYLDVLAK